MKIYTYDSKVVSLFPEFKERPWEPVGEDVMSVDNPDEADFIICPVALHRIKSKKPGRTFNQAAPVELLPHWGKYESKHVFFDCSDFEHSLNDTKAILIRCNLRPWMKTENSIPWFWPVEDLGKYVDVPDGIYKFDVGFQGWLSTDIRKNSVDSCQKEFGARCDNSTYNDFFGLMTNLSEQDRRRESFLLGQQNTKIMLAPQSIPGVFPYRFYEAMSAQRIPALFCTDYILPFQDEIDWDKCTLRFPADQAQNAGTLIREFLNNTSEEKMAEMARYGREIWLKWLNRDKQPELIAYTLKKRLGK